MGGTETFGKFLSHPYSALLEQRTGVRMINLGVAGAGPDAFLEDAGVREILSQARGVVVQVPEVQNFSNPLYSVHPRRNDRFVRASAELRALYPDVDLTDYAFTRHLLQGLRAHGPKRFEKVSVVLQAAWVGRMRALLTTIPGPRILLRIASNPTAAPVRITDGMLDGLRAMANEVVEVADASSEGMIFGPTERAAAAALPGPAAHERAAAALENWARALE